MKIYIDLRTNRLMRAPGLPGTPTIADLRFTRRRQTRMELQFLRDGITPVRVSANGINFTVKPSGDYAELPVVFTTDWTLPAIDDPDPVYVASPNFNTSEVGALFDEEQESIQLMGEFNWRLDSGPISTSETFQLVVSNDVWREDDLVPDPLDPPDAYERKSNRGQPDGYASLNGAAVVVGVPVQLNLGFPFAPAGGERDSVLIAQSVEFAASGHTVIISGAPAVAVDFELLLNDVLIGTITTSEGTSAFALDAATTTGTGLSRFELVAPAAVIAAPFAITLLLKGLTA